MGRRAACKDVVYLSGEVGLGGGVVAAGRPLGGSGGYAGEVGHMVVNAKGRRCRCGARGCWETEVGEDALLAGLARARARARRLPRQSSTPPPAGTEGRARSSTGSGWWLGLGIGNLVNIFNPEVVVPRRSPARPLPGREGSRAGGGGVGDAAGAR